MTTVVPLLMASVKRALRRAGASDDDVRDAMTCYVRAVERGDSTRDAAVWALRFYFLMQGATAPRGLKGSVQRAVRKAYALVISDSALIRAATIAPRKTRPTHPRGAA